jgi:hypothetical protein
MYEKFASIHAFLNQTLHTVNFFPDQEQVLVSQGVNEYDATEHAQRQLIHSKELFERDSEIQEFIKNFDLSKM